MDRSARATLIGFAAVLLWSLLAVLTAASGAIPPFQLAAMTFALGGAAGLGVSALRGAAVGSAFRQPRLAWLLGVGGLFGYHALYFTALKTAPPAAAGLLNYLWPLLIVLFSALLPGEGLRAHHIAGAALGFCGTVLVLSGGQDLAALERHGAGFGAALAAAFVWAGYSVLSRRFASRVPTEAVGPFCLATALLALICHRAFEDSVWPAEPIAWLAVAALGLGPVGAAFYAWDHGVKRGDIRVLGALSYAAPVLSTALLVAAGYASASASLALSAGLIAGGGLLAAKDLLRQRPASA